MGDLNNTEAARERLMPVDDPEYRFRSFPIRAGDDDPAVRNQYRPFILDDEISSSDWIMKLELATAAKMVETEILSQGKDRLRVLVLYGSLRSRFVRLRHGNFTRGDLQKLTEFNYRRSGHTRSSLLTKHRAFSSVLAVTCESTILQACPSKTTSSTITQKSRSSGGSASGVMVTSG
jgi:hypothetical protein